MSIYIETVREGLGVTSEEAEFIYLFICDWLCDDFRWSEATTKQIILKAKTAQAFIADPTYRLAVDITLSEDSL